MKKIISILAASTAMACGHAAAEPGYYLVSTYEDEGARTIDFKLWNVKVPGSPAVYAPEIGIGYNVTKRWYTELYTTYLHTQANGTEPYDVTWQNDYMLTQGQYPFDLAMHTSIKRHHEADEGEGFEFGPVVQTEFGRTQVNLNIFFERDYRGDVSAPMQMKYQWQVKYRWRPAFQFGLQGFGELGKWNDWADHDRQSHRIGPAIFGSVPIDDKHEFKYEIAYFTGKIFTQNAKVFSMRAQYEF